MSQPETYEETRRKLEAFDDLLAVCEMTLLADLPLPVKAIVRAAIAKAKGEREEDKRGDWIATCPASEQGGEDMRRLVAAVNACAGIPTEALEAGVIADLLAACEAARAIMAKFYLTDGVRSVMNELAAAFAKAKGGEMTKEVSNGGT